jgi:hypothetical protein
LRLGELVRRFEALAPALTNALAATSAQRLAAAAPFGPTNNPEETIGTLLAGILGKLGALLAPGQEGH